VNAEEMAKCEALVEAIRIHGLRNMETQLGAHTYTYEMMPKFRCVLGTDQYDCMQKIFTNEADLIELGTGLSYTAGEYYNMIPLVAEKYVLGQLHSMFNQSVRILKMVLINQPYVPPCTCVVCVCMCTGLFITVNITVTLHRLQITEI